MSKTRRIAISYSRFSDPKQARGDSEDRQGRDFRAFCERHDLTPLSESFVDRGRSGYHDEHRKKGRLGVLIAAAKDGRFEEGTVIVIEAWDRLGRLRPDKMTALIAELVQLGIGIGVCKLGDIFTEEDFGTHKWTTLAVFVQLAYQESKQKAERVAASWESRRQKAREGAVLNDRGKLVTGRVPAWLEVVGGKVVAIPERVAALKRIFRLAADGYGRVRILKALVEEGVPPFGTEKWTIPYLARILCDRRVCGEYQPRRTDDTADGAVIAAHYPRVIEEEEYLLARAGQDGRRGKGGRRDRRHVNVFQSLLVHARDGEGFVLHNHGAKGKVQLILVNSGGMSGRSQMYTLNYAAFETAVLTFLSEVDPRDVLPAGRESPNKADALRAKLATVRRDLAGLKDDLKTGYSKTLAAVLREREAEEERVASQLQDELARDAKPVERAWKELPTLATLVKDGGDEARLKLRPVLRRVVEEIRVLTVRRGSFILAAAQVFFPGGTRRDYLIVNQSAGFNRPGGWNAISLATVAAPDTLDLRKKADAAALERLLLALDVDRITGENQ